MLYHFTTRTNLIFLSDIPLIPVFFIKLSSWASSSILLLILTYNLPAFCPPHLHSSPVYQITDLINLSHSPSSSLYLSSIHLFLWCFISATKAFSVFSPSCNRLVSPELLPLTFLWGNVWVGGVNNACWGHGNADVVQIGAMLTEHLQMAKDWCQLTWLF